VGNLLFGDGVTLQIVRIVFCIVFAFFAIISVYLNIRRHKTQIRRFNQLFDLVFMATSPTLGVMAIWAAFNENVLEYLPLDYMLLAAGTGAVIIGFGKIIDPTLQSRSNRNSEDRDPNFPSRKSEDTESDIGEFIGSRQHNR